MSIVIQNRNPRSGRLSSSAQLLAFFVSSVGLTTLVAASAWAADTPLGAPGYWSWLLTGMQVLALWGAGTNRWWGWLLGAAVQPPWIAYAVITGQLGFIPGCAISAAVQTHSFFKGQQTSRTGHLVRLRLETTEAAT